MNFNEYQKKAWETAMYPNKGKNLYYPALGLGESGEVQGKIKKIMRDDYGITTPEKTKEILKEMGDLIWYIAALCTELKIDFDDVAKVNLNKLVSRKERGTIQGSGDNR